ncbi:BTB/POZ and MATH domain-containing protein 3-like [Pyrus ussuriensis x Pyrus communis]|uniref:BTB/POZ and MATH domain-containing protein 3-like n=1 Tax=Pyrus ussuriensis x Pyrus communis TaxID=2448454 RepID=A0A5N5FDC0_9ROSA|nr:BTB/POZ and MATH domain-containing protein 3-like [Pyrus ussuriensis x Pyrus communis]
MTSLNFNDQNVILRTISDAPPTHYTVKIQSVSLLTKNSLEKYKSGDFETGGYKWKLAFYPNGNKNKNVTDHTSLYLVMSGSNAPQISSEVYAVFRLFLLDQNNRNYLVFEVLIFAKHRLIFLYAFHVHFLEQKEMRFHGLKLEWGFDLFVPHGVFTEASNGLLIDDTCVLGAEVFVSKESSTGKGECLSMLDGESYDSKVFTAGDQKWKIQLYPKGKSNGVGTHLALYLALAEPKSLPRGWKIYVEFSLRLLDQVHARHQFITLGHFKQASMGFVLKDTCFVEVEVTVHGITSDCSQIVKQ